MVNDITSVRNIVSPQAMTGTAKEKQPVDPVAPIDALVQKKFADGGEILPQSTSEGNKKEEVERAVAAANHQFVVQQRALQFQLDDSSEHLVIKVIDKETNEVVRQIPSKDFLELSRKMEEMQDIFMVDENA